MGLNELHVGDEIITGPYATIVGEPTRIHGRPAFRQALAGDGMLMFGPYVDLAEGIYEYSTVIRCALPNDGGHIALDVAADIGQTIISREELGADQFREDRLLVRRFELTGATRRVEIRAAVHGTARWSVSVPVLRRI